MGSDPAPVKYSECLALMNTFLQGTKVCNDSEYVRVVGCNNILHC